MAARIPGGGRVTVSERRSMLVTDLIVPSPDDGAHAEGTLPMKKDAGSGHRDRSRRFSDRVVDY